MRRGRENGGVAARPKLPRPSLDSTNRPRKQPANASAVQTCCRSWPRRHDQGPLRSTAKETPAGRRPTWPTVRRSRTARPLMSRCGTALWAPKGTPAEIIAKLNGGRGEVAGASRARKRSSPALGPGHPAPPNQLTAAGTGAFQKAEIEKVVADRQGRGHQGRMNDEGRRTAVSSAGPAGTGPLGRGLCARALERIEIMDRGGFRTRCGWPSTHFNHFSASCPSVHMPGARFAAGGAPTNGCASARAVSLAGALSIHPLAPRGGSGAARHAVGAAGVNWGAGSRLRPFRVQRLRRTAGKKSSERFPRGRSRSSCGAWTQERLSFQGHTLQLRRHRGAAQAPAATPSAGPWMAATSGGRRSTGPASRGFFHH